MILARSSPCLGFDASTRIIPARASALTAIGMRFGVRYVGLPGNAAGEDITADEIAVFEDAKLALMIVQHVRLPKFNTLNYALGIFDGTYAANKALAVGYPRGAHLWCDLEGIQSDTTNTMQYAAGWCHSVAPNYQPGGYIGYNVPLTPAQLYSLAFTSYWKASAKADVATRGFALIQLYPSVAVGGVLIDVDVLQPDLKGETPMWAIRG